MRVVLSSNVPHYHYAARALERRGLLHRYITSIVPGRSRLLERVLTEHWRLKLEGRSVNGVPSSRIVSLMLPELTGRAARATKAVSKDHAIALQNVLYDVEARRHVERCDVFHWVSSVGLRSARKAKRLGALLVCDERAEFGDYQREILTREYRELGLPFRPPGLAWDAQLKAEYGLADYLVVGSEYAKDTFVDAGWETARVVVVPYGFEPALFSPAERRTDGRFVVLFCGQITPRKGVHHLVAAFRQLALPDAELQLVGPTDPALEQLVRDWMRVPSIRIVGEEPKVRLRERFAQATVLAMPSVADAQPLACLEAMACACPVIATTAMGTREIVRDGVDGYVIAPRDVDALSERLQRLHGDRSLAARLGDSAAARAREYTWDRYEERVLALYDYLGDRAGLTT
ncbi:MAG TPA: glycosyltransferase family 4 protein [Gaiellaceae bacterium]|nr:glycosyltransferase family 4 protein [Gaiellaceae bacterium]